MKADSFAVTNYLQKMEVKELILDVMKKAKEPLNAGKIADLTGIDRKDVDKAMAKLKAEEVIESPRRCYWQAKQI